MGTSRVTSARAAIATLLIGSAVLLLGNGLQVTLLPLRAEIEDFSTSLIGLMGTAFFAGFAAGCLIGPRVVRRVGHIRCFAGFAALAAVGALAYPLLVDPFFWCLLRALTGLCFALLYMVVESWLNEAVDNRVRGAVLSLYIIVGNLVTMGGQLMVNLYDPSGPLLFSLVAMLIALSLVPLSLTPAAAPKPVEVSSLDLAGLFRNSPSGFLGCLFVGLAEGAFWSLGPVFAQGRGLSVAEVTLFMGAVVLGGTLSQWPLGRLSDRIDRRLVILGCCLGAVGSALLLAGAGLEQRWAWLALAALHGAFLVPLYPLCLAHANDFAPGDRLVETSSALLLIYAVGAILGPLAAGPLMDAVGTAQLFVAIAVALATLALIILLRLAKHRVAAAAERVTFVPMPKTTPSVYALEEDEEEAPPLSAS